MNAKEGRRRPMACAVVVFGLCFAAAQGETVYVDSDRGDDGHPGSRDRPVRTIGRAAQIVNDSDEPGPTTVRVAPGLYVIDQMVTFENQRAYSREARLTIEATVLPDDPRWVPARMPIVLSTVQGQPSANEMHALTLRIEVNHATIRGLNFLANPRPRTWHYAIHRFGKDLEDLVVTQCLFLGGGEALQYSSPVCANGRELVVDHCIFYDCDIPVIFWNAEGGTSKGNAMRYCIVDGADVAAVWTCQTAEDFDFHHNIVTRSQYVWMRPPGSKTTYRLRDCVITDSKYASGCGTASKIFGPTGPDVTFQEENVTKQGAVRLVTANIPPEALSADRPRNYLHVVPGTLGSELGAGLFTKSPAENTNQRGQKPSDMDDVSRAADEVWQTIKNINRSWLSGKIDELAGYCHPKVVIIAPGFGRRSEGREASLRSYEGFSSRATVTHFKEEDPIIDVFDDTAVATYRIEIAADVNGQPYEEQGRELHVFVREAGRWLSVWRMVVPDDQ